MKFASHHGVGKRFATSTLAQIDKKYFPDVFKYAREYRKYLKRGEGLLLSGPPGIGKTFAVTALMKYIKEQEGGRFDYYFITAPKFFDKYSNHVTAGELDAHRGKTWDRVFEDVDGMVLNDLGKEDRTRDWQQEAASFRLGRLLRARHEEQKPIFITTNFHLIPPKDDSGVTFKQVYGASIWSLIQDMTCARVQIQSPNLRDRKARRENGEEEDDD